MIRQMIEAIFCFDVQYQLVHACWLEYEPRIWTDGGMEFTSHTEQVYFIMQIARSSYKLDVDENEWVNPCVNNQESLKAGIGLVGVQR